MEICLLKVIFRHRLALQRRRRVLNEEKMSDVKDELHGEALNKKMVLARRKVHTETN